MKDKECVPYAPSLIESMRSLGYSFSSAIADIIDNSISAHSHHISIVTEPSSNPYLYVLDDGFGMTKAELYEAMRYGSGNPQTKRSQTDLGRFGLGLKSASLSQCRKLVVISKKNGELSGYSWDLDYVISCGSWMLKEFSESEINEYPQLSRLFAQKSGTYVFWSEFDRIKEGTGDISVTFNKLLDDMVNHLSLVFHRFIEEYLEIDLNGYLINARDPFLTHHRATQRKRESSFYINDEKITLKPFILPHISKLSPEDIVSLGGKDKITNDQGFYVYRNKRLIIWGTWFRLERKDELNKLARVMVDIPNSLDSLWAIDIKKSSAMLPDIIKKNMFNAVYESVLSSEAVHTYRGRKDKKDDGLDYVWERIKCRTGYEYQINREIPQIKLLESTLDSSQLKLLASVINTIEDAFPVAALYVDAAKGNVEDKVIEPGEEFEKVWSDLQNQMQYVREHNLPVRKFYQAFLEAEPYRNNEEIKKRIREEMAKL